RDPARSGCTANCWHDCRAIWLPVWSRKSRRCPTRCRLTNIHNRLPQRAARPGKDQQMEQRLRHPGDGFERTLKRLARQAGTAPRTPCAPESAPHWEALALLAPAARAAALESILRGNLQLADNPRANRERLFDPKPLLFATAEQLLTHPVSAHPREAAELPIALLNAQ